jgi:hypothetical protein
MNNEMKPGRELDALIAEKVMGYPAFAKQVLEQLGAHLLGEGEHEHCLVCGRGIDGTLECLPYYSTDISAAWEVVEKAGLLKRFTLEQTDHGWEVWDRNEVSGDDLIAGGLSAPHAICLAALKAVGVD